MFDPREKASQSRVLCPITKTAICTPGPHAPFPVRFIRLSKVVTLGRLPSLADSRSRRSPTSSQETT